MRFGFCVCVLVVVTFLCQSINYKKHLKPFWLNDAPVWSVVCTTHRNQICCSVKSSRPVLCLSVPPSLSVFPSACLSVGSSVFVRLSVHLCVRLSVCLSVDLSVYPFANPSFCFSVRLPVHPTVCPYVHPFVLHVRPSVCTSVRLCPSVHPCVLYVRPSIRTSISVRLSVPSFKLWNCLSVRLLLLPVRPLAHHPVQIVELI